ncbi:MAG: oligosaccharide flippase family protein [Anaerolineae bacterium]|nr:oligosaccharide flippase family protein [Anaerolineae bacterium]
MSNNLARRSIASVGWNAGASVITITVLFVRSVLLARLLPVDVFGVYAGVGALIALTVVLPNFGMGAAFLHRAPETEDEERAAAVHFTLKLIFTLLWAAAMIAWGLIFTQGQTRTTLIVVTIATAGIQLAQTPDLILTRRVVHRRLALLQSATAISTTLVAVFLAWRGVTLWALLATDIVTLVVTLVMLYVWRPVWRPRLAWVPDVVRYYLRFGSKVVTSVGLLQALNNVDDLWTRYYLGTTAMGYYSRAYTFATYPRRVLAGPVNDVAGGTYAELKRDRRRLSQAFFRSNALLVRTGFFMGGVLALIAPELVMILLGEKWLPMLQAFRLMLVFTLLDPIKLTVGNLFVAVGQPELLIRTRLVQLAVLVIGLYTLGFRLGITGVALVVDVMLIVGMVVLFHQARVHVDYSLRQLFAVPTLALILGLAAGAGAMLLAGNQATANLLMAVLKGGAFSVVFVAVLWIFEHRQLTSMAIQIGIRLPWLSLGRSRPDDAE